MAEDELKELNLDQLEDESLLDSFKGGRFGELFFKNKTPFLLALIGLILLALGAFLYMSGYLDSNNKIEVIEDTTASQSSNSFIYVELAGAVQKPGVYKMKNGDRVEDLMVMSGGLNANADRSWVEKNVNRAAKLVDGQKVYIPEVNEQTSVMSAKSSSLDENSSINTNNTQTKLININTASQEELESLWGIGPVTGKNIIEHRPYSNVSELKTRGILKSNVYETNKDKLTVY